jgi:hypothetical protein
MSTHNESDLTRPKCLLHEMDVGQKTSTARQYNEPFGTEVRGQPFRARLPSKTEDEGAFVL